MAEPGRPAAALSLVYADAGGRPRVFAIPEGTTTLGRASDNDLVLEDPSVTAHHVVLIREGERVELRDLFSGDTLVNDERRRSGALAAGDVLSLGQVRLRVMKVVPRRTPPPAPPAASRAATDRLARQPDGPGPATNGRPGAQVDERAEPKTQRMLRPAPLRTGASGAASRAATSAYPRPGSGRLPMPVSSSAATRRMPAPPADEEPAAAPGAAPSGPPSGAPPAPPAPSEELLGLREREARRERQLQRARQLSDEMLQEDDFERILEHIALGFIDIFAADRAVTVLFEEDGRNPLLTVERRRDGTDDGTGVAQEIVDRCLQVRTVVRIAGGHQGLGGLATPLLSRGKAVGLLYFERTTGSDQPLDAADVHLMAMLANQAAVVIAPLLG
jgi:hypothetical protein